MRFCWLLGLGLRCPSTGPEFVCGHCFWIWCRQKQIQIASRPPMIQDSSSFCWWLCLCEVNYMCIIVVERIVISNSWLMCCWYHFIDVMQIGYADWVLSKGPCWFPFKFVQRAHLSKGRTACINGTAYLEWGEVTQFELRYCCGSGSASLSCWPSAKCLGGNTCCNNQIG